MYGDIDLTGYKSVYIFAGCHGALGTGMVLPVEAFNVIPGALTVSDYWSDTNLGLLKIKDRGTTYQASAKTAGLAFDYKIYGLR